MNGIPRPLLTWRRQGSANPIEQSSTIRSHNGVLTLMMATKADEGIATRTESDLRSSSSSLKGFYECIGSNTAGEDIKTAQLIYAGKLFD
jgi:hypothetical protein